MKSTKLDTRTQIAIAAMQAIITSGWPINLDNEDEALVSVSFRIADAVLLHSPESNPTPRSVAVDSNREFVDEVINLWNKLYGTKIRYTRGRADQIKTRLKTFSKEDIIKAINNRFSHVQNNPWYSEPKNAVHKSNIDLVLRNDDYLQKWLLYEAKNNVSGQINKIKFN